MVRGLRNAVHVSPTPTDSTDMLSCMPRGLLLKHRLSLMFRRGSILSPLAIVARRRSSAPGVVSSVPSTVPLVAIAATTITAIDSEIVFGVGQLHAVATSKGVRRVNEDRHRVISSLERYRVGLLATEKKKKKRCVRTLDDALQQRAIEAYASKLEAPAFDAKKLSRASRHAGDTAFYGIYDGHGGATCSSLLALLLPLYLLRQRDYNSNLESAFVRACHEMNDEILKREASQQCEGGSTAITLLVRRNVAYVCNTGDCRAILVSRRHGRGQDVQALTTDHKAANEVEKQRIEAAGGMVLYVHGIPRVNGHLAVARAFGNAELRDVVIATPDVTTHILAPGDEFIVLASDGLWDVLSNDQVLSCIRNHPWLDTNAMANVLVDRAIELGSSDNVTVLIVDVRKRS